MTETMLTVDEIASSLRVSKMTVYRLVRSGDLVAYRIAGRTLRIPESSFQTYMKKCEVPRG